NAKLVEEIRTERVIPSRFEKMVEASGRRHLVGGNAVLCVGKRGINVIAKGERVFLCDVVINFERSRIFTIGLERRAFENTEISTNDRWLPENWIGEDSGSKGRIWQGERINAWNHSRHSQSASCRSHNRHGTGRRVGDLADAFIVEEEEQFVFDDGAGDAAAELVQMDRGGAGLEIVFGVEDVVAQEFKQTAVKGVTTRLGDDVDDVAIGAAVLRTVIARHDFKLLNAVDADTI